MGAMRTEVQGQKRIKHKFKRRETQWNNKKFHSIMQYFTEVKGQGRSGKFRPSPPLPFLLYSGFKGAKSRYFR